MNLKTQTLGKHLGAAPNEPEPPRLCTVYVDSRALALNPGPIRTVGEAAALPMEKRHPHALKHSLASHLVAGNVNLALVKQALGHKSISSTMEYVGVSDGQAAEAAQAALMRLF